MTATQHSTSDRELIVVRHAEAHCNVLGVVGGPRGCSGLTDTGRIQADQAAIGLALRLAGRKVHIYTSPRLRALQTAAVIAAHLRVEAVPSAELRDPDCGDADGMPWQEVLARAPQRDDPNVPILAGGESWVQHVKRVNGALTRLLGIHSSATVVVVGHAETVAAAYHLFLDMPAAARLSMKFIVDNASFTGWIATAGDDPPPHRGWSLTAHNVTHRASA